jgi:predicted ATPase
MLSTMADSGVIKLDLERVGLQGRGDESAALLKAYNASLTSSCSIYLRGASGTGKSTLVRATLQGLNNTLFVQGKLDQQVGQPYGAFARALSELSDLAFAMENADLDRDIALLVGQQECSLLLKFAPNLHQFIARHQKVNEEAVSEEHASELHTSRHPRTKTQLAWSCCSEKLKMDFLAIISVVTTYSAVVLFLDDLQWADRASIDIIQFLQESRHVRGFLLVGAHTFQANTPPSIRRRLDNLLVTGRTSSISIQNFDVHCFNVILSSLVRCDTEETMPLTELVFHKTQGNRFHVLQLLQWIQQPNMLFYSLTAHKWEWNLRNIQRGTEMSGDVVRLVGAAFTSLSQDTRMRLQVAACLGNQFDASAIDAMVNAWCLTSKKSALPEQPRRMAAWEEACSASIINHSSGPTGIRYEFSHNHFQQAAMDLIKEESERLRLHHRIGQFLVDRFHQSDTSEGWMLLAAVDQLNKSIPLITDKKDLHMLAKLNLEAAERVAERSGFFSASVLLNTGLVLLGDRKWTNHYELALGMTIKSAKVEYCCGRHEICKLRFDEIASHGRSLEDKTGVYLTYLDSLLAQNETKKALEVGIEFLHQLGFKFPKRVGTCRIIREYSNVRRLLKRRTDDDLVSHLPTMTDWKSQQALKVLLALAVPAWLSDQMAVYGLIVIRMASLTLMYGATPYSGLAYSGFGVLLAKFSQLDQAKRMGDLGLKMQDRFKYIDDCMEAETMFFTATTLAHLTRPLHDLLDMELKAHDAGFQIGNMKVVAGAALFYTAAYYHCGLPLQVMTEDAAKFADELKESNQQISLVECLLYRQAGLNLMGRSDDPLILQGEAIDDLSVVLGTNGSQKHSTRQVYTLLMMQLCFFMGDLKQAKQMAEENIACKDEDYPLFPAMIYPFWRSLIYFSLVRKGRTKYRRKAFTQKRIIEGFVKAGIGNCHYMLMILEAEEAAMEFLGSDGRRKTSKQTTLCTLTPSRNKQTKDEMSMEIRQMYDAAIKSASRSGFMHARALANERACIFVVDSGSAKMRGWDGAYLKEARDLYAEWGASVKVEQLEQTYAWLMGSDEVRLRVSSHIKGRARFDTKAKARHRSTDCFELSSGDGSDDDCKSFSSSDTLTFRKLPSASSDLFSPFSEHDVFPPFSELVVSTL